MWWFSPYRLRLSRGPDEQGGLVLASATGKQQASTHQDGWLGVWGWGGECEVGNRSVALVFAPPLRQYALVWYLFLCVGGGGGGVRACVCVCACACACMCVWLHLAIRTPSSFLSLVGWFCWQVVHGEGLQGRDVVHSSAGDTANQHGQHCALSQSHGHQRPPVL